MVEALALARRFWWAPVILGLSLALFVTRQTLADVRAKAAIEKADTARQTAELQAANAEEARAAADTYARRVSSLEPIIVRSTNTVEKYAQTPEGRAPCLGLDRVQSILAARADLFAAAAASEPGPVPAGTPVADAAQQR